MTKFLFILTFLFCTTPFATRAQKVVPCTSNKKVHTSDADSAMKVSETDPRPKDGLTAYYDWIGSHMDEKLKSKKMSRKKKVYVSFIVNENGSRSDFKVTKGIGAPFDAEALKLTRESPLPWIAAQCGDKKVKAWTRVIVEF